VCEGRQAITLRAPTDPRPEAGAAGAGLRADEWGLEGLRAVGSLLLAHGLGRAVRSVLPTYEPTPQ
jgi:hypothetical protein